MTDKPTAGDPTPDYMAAKAEWMERYGSYIAQARNWRAACFGAIVVAAIGVAGAAYEGGRTHIVPYVVEVDHLGQTVRLAQAVRSGSLNQPVVRHVLTAWVSKVRSRLTDPLAQRDYIESAYKYVDQNAEIALSRYYKRHKPFSGRDNGNRSVTITSAIPLGTPTAKGGSYQIDWTEKQYNLHGRIVGVQNWQGVITYANLPVKSAKQAIGNPFGIYITSFSWNKTL
jgi:type IV secretion system protein VirB5